MRCYVMLIYFTAVCCFETGLTLENSRYRSMMNKGAADEDCFDVYAKCRSKRGCKATLRALNKNCIDHNGRCKNESNFELCGEIMDGLHAYGFPKKRCQCVRKIPRCFPMLNKVYANPCIENSQLLKNNRNSMSVSAPQQGAPVESGLKETKSLTKTHNNVTTDTTGDLKKVTTTEPTRDQVFVAEEEEAVFGDEGFAKPPPSKELASKPTSHGALSRSGVNHHKEKATKKEEVKIMATTAFGERDSVSTDKTDLTTSFEVDRLALLRSKLREEEAEITKDMRLRIGSIVIGSIFVLAILLGAAFIGCKRMRKSQLLYKKGKSVQHGPQDMS